MTELDRNASITGEVEKQAHDLIKEETTEKPTTEKPTAEAESGKAQEPAQTPAQRRADSTVGTGQTRRQPRTRRQGRAPGDRRAARRELYADASVPRVRYERRLGTTAHSRAYLKKALCLYSDRAQVFFENNYERVNANLIVSTLVVEAVGGENFAVQVAQTIEEKFSALENEMMRALNELKRIAKEKGIPEDSQIPSYDHKRNYEPPLHTPQSAQFMTIVSLFDRIVARAEGAWINKVISSQTRKALISTWEKRLIAFVRDLQQLRNDAMETARGAGFGQRAKAIADQVRNEKQPELEQKDVATSDVDDNPEKSKA